MPPASGRSQERALRLRALPGARARSRGRRIRQGLGAAGARPYTGSRGDLRAHPGHQPGIGGVALEPRADRHVERGFRHGPGILRAAARFAARFERGAGGPGRVELRRRRTRPHRQVLHAAGLGRPGHFEGWFNLALAHQKLSRWQPAAEAYEEAIKLRPQSCEAHTNLGIVREQLGDRAGARAAYERALAANPDSLAPIWNMALLLEHGGQFDDAERWYKTVLEKAPKEEEARFRLGYLRLQREDYRGAMEAFEGCLKYRPQWPEAQANLALAYAGLGDRPQAERI